MIKTKFICGILGDWFELKDIQVNTLPENFICLSSLSCEESSLTELPKGLVVLGNLYIGDCQITSLPEQLVVYGDLILLNSSIFDIPTDACLCGSVVALQVNSMPTYNLNTKTDRYVCTNNGEVIPYKEELYHTRTDEENQVRRTPLTFYKGYAESKNAITIDNKTYYSCSSYNQGTIFCERLLLKQSPAFEKYLNYDVNEKRWLPQLIEIFKEITGACDDGVEQFLKKEKAISKVNKYSILQACELLKNSTIAQSYFFTFLFIDYFCNREIFY